jgi:hypothetical protein
VSAGSDEDALLREYLLSTLPESERLDLASRYFADDELFARLEEAETDLIDAYVAGDLSEEERRRFEETLATFPGRADRVAFARALRALRSEETPPGRAGRRAASSWWAVAAALAVAGIGGIWMLRQAAGYEAQLERLRAERDRLAQSQRDLTAELERLRRSLAAAVSPGSTDPVARTVTFLLTAGLTRSVSSANVVAIPADAGRVRLELPVDAPPAASYRARLERVDGTELLRRDHLTASRGRSGLQVVLELDAALLPADDWVLFLEDLSAPAAEPIAEYAFRVVR